MAISLFLYGDISYKFLSIFFHVNIDTPRWAPDKDQWTTEKGMPLLE